MPEMIDRRDRATLFRTRLLQALEGRSQSWLARETGLDRSTISALLAPGTRLPNAQAAADCASVLGVSCDWLLGLTDRRDPPDVLAARAVTLVPAARALFDDTILAWHRAAKGAKIRHVPATLPDLLKTPEVLAFEYAAILPDPGPALSAFQAQREGLDASLPDFEIALPRHELVSFASGTGYWSGLAPELRRAQLDHFAEVLETRYPALRLYLFDAHRVFSAPVTVFGSDRAVVYLGQQYLVLTDQARVAEAAQHFDHLVREAGHSARDTPGLIRGLAV
ncbi:transcriptional regulator [Rhodobacteraceae bacterium CYK-10]|uniref:Transcriptional regulator n=2 Tax=Stagnihabitans tardus TaxID=2699202 RepID=A0AAE4YAE6_9RHOB|nr:Scr1 family TA system antitoxin-like transcriptional regulator [Stagnihabitans tardus]NBZ87683.1 transcriptional regulator [Stagnihabitans tardus]